MPIYEYKCDNGHVFEAIQKMTDEPLRECEECGAHASRVLTPPAIHFKGSGFHNTDYGKKKSGANGSSESSGDSKKTDSASSESKSDSGKSDSKSESKPAASAAD